jgi:predicted nucleic acid-binding protein
MSFLQGLSKARLVFVDTAPVIYFVERNPEYLANVQMLFEMLDDGKLFAVISPVTLAECLVLPYKLGKPDAVQVFTDLLVNGRSVKFHPIDDRAALKAAELRARYALSLIDAFQIALAIQSGCDAFVTNDLELKRVSELNILMVAE